MLHAIFTTYIKVNGPKAQSEFLLLNEFFHKNVIEMKKFHSSPISNVLFLRHIMKHPLK